jgi:non-specific serine/threonine protein kinase
MPSALVGRSNQLQVVSRSSSDAKPFKAGLKSFIAEARLLARFDHPSLVKVYRFWEANNTAYMAMPLYSGITLKQARAQMSGPPPEAWLRTVLWSLLEALKVLHNNNTLHRDVSPDNVFLQDIGPPVLLDLGAARRAISEGHQKHTAILKVNYAPIEQYADAEDLREGPWTDLYAVAAVVHGCLSNSAPMPATTRLVKDGMPKVSQLADTAARHFDTPYSSSFVRAVDHALALQPANRPQTVDQFCAELELHAPSDLLHFDWRSALGLHTKLVEVDTQPGELTTQMDTVVDDRTQVLGSSNPQTTVSAVAPVEPATQVLEPGKWKVLVLGALVAIALVIGVVKFWKPRERTLPLSATPALLQIPAPQASTPVVVASEVVAQPEVKHPVEVRELPVQKPAAKKVAAPIATPATVPASALPPKHTGESTVKGHSTEAVSRPPDPIAPPASTTVPEQQALCATSNFLARPMCIYRECQKPENSRLPICIESRKKWEASDKPQ